jgi:anti-sigma regulatory factor (Ser/Thr protein kinase)
MDQKNDHGVRVLTLSGRLDLPGAAAALKAIPGSGDTEPQAVVFDLADLVEPVERQVLMIFPVAQRRIGRWPEREVRLAGASVPVTQDLHRLNIDRFITIDTTLLGALDQIYTRQHAVRRTHSLVPALSSPAQARQCVDDLLVSVPADFRATAELVTSELATNVLRHVRDQFTLSLALTDDELLVAVTDTNGHIPTLGPLSVDAEGGRGLHLIDNLSTSWGVRLIYKGGKTVWSRITTAT